MKDRNEKADSQVTEILTSKVEWLEVKRSQIIAPKGIERQKSINANKAALCSLLVYTNYC